MAIENKSRQIILRIDGSEDSAKAYRLLAKTCSGFTVRTTDEYPIKYPLPSLCYGYMENGMLASGEVYIGFEAIDWWCRGYDLRISGRSLQDIKPTPAPSLLQV